MTKIGWFSLIEELGAGYHIAYTAKDIAPRITLNGVHVAFIFHDDSPPFIETSLRVKWRSAPHDDWVPFMDDFDDIALPIINRQFRSQWEAAGFVLGDETLSSFYRPAKSPEVQLPMAEMWADFFPQSRAEAVRAIQFIESTCGVAWID